MNFQWEWLRAIVPLSFMVFWALSSLFNRDGKPKPPAQRMPNLPPRPAGGVRPAPPTQRWGTPGQQPSPAPALPATRPARPAGDDGIVILSSETRPPREGIGRSSVNLASKRPSKGKPVVPQRKAEPTPARPGLAGVSQNVNQHLANATIEMAPLSGMPSVATATAVDLGMTAGRAADSSITGPRSAVAWSLADPIRLREAFVINEILQPPVSMRNRRIGPTLR